MTIVSLNKDVRPPALANIPVSVGTCYICINILNYFTILWLTKLNLPWVMYFHFCIIERYTYSREYYCNK
jgi:hypothetical protein